jgi:uncharacterized protein (DUF433 family)
MSAEPTITQEQFQALIARLERLETTQIALMKCWPFVSREVADLLTSRERLRSPTSESPVSPWNYLVRRNHPWRQQLSVRGRNMTVRQLVGTVRANQWAEEEAARNLDLPREAIREAFQYAREHEELLAIEGEIERLMLERGGFTSAPEPVSG